MLKNKQKVNSDELPRGFRPLAVVSAFFHPVSETEVERTLIEAQKTSESVRNLLASSDDLHQKIDADLANTLKLTP